MDPTPFPVPERYKESYPVFSLIVRGLFGLAEAVLAVYIIFGLYDIFAYLFASYLALAATVLLPLARCTRCHYYGKRCHIGWGKMASFLYPKGEEELFGDNFKYSVFLYPVWIVPLLIGAMQLARQRTLEALLVFLIYLVVLYFSRRLLQWRAGCKGCHQRLFCPGAASFKRKRQYLTTEAATETPAS